MTISLPKYKIEIAFASLPFSGSLTWTDVTTDVQLQGGVSIQHGRQDQFAQISAGQVKFTLDNLTGTYSPGNSSSSLFPNVVLGKAVRIRATEDSVTFAPRYFGYIDSYTVSWNDETGLFSNVDIVAVDLLSLLALRRFGSNNIAAFYQVDGVVDYWDMGDAAGTLIPLNKGAGGTQLVAVTSGAGSSVIFGTATGPGTDDQTAVQVTQAGFFNTSAPLSYGYTAGLTLEGYVLVPSAFVAGTDTCKIIETLDGTGTVASSLQLTTVGGTPGTAHFSVTNSLGLFGDVFGTTVLNDGHTHHVAATYSPAGGGTISVYVDGVLEGTTTAVGTGSQSMGVEDVLTVVSAAQIVGSHIGAYATPLTATQVSNHAVGLNGFVGETSGARFARLAALARLTATTIGPFGTQSMGPMDSVQDTDLFTLLQSVQDTENGVFYVDTAGNLTLQGRAGLYNQTASVTLTSGMYEADLQFILDKTNFLNDVTATGSSGVPEEYSDLTSQGKYGVLSNQITLNTTSDAEALSYAQWRVGSGDPQPRAPQMHIDLMSQQSLVPTLLASWWACDLGDLLTISGMPTNGVGTSTSLLIQGWTETLTDTDYDVVINTSPAPAQGWQLGNATFGKLGTTTVLAY